MPAAMVKRPETLHNTVTCPAGMSWSSGSQHARWALGVVPGNGLMDDREPSIAAASRLLWRKPDERLQSHVERAPLASVAPQADETARSFFNFDGHLADRRFFAVGCCDRPRRIVRPGATRAAAVARQTPIAK
jgi:hypothetical protein